MGARHLIHPAKYFSASPTYEQWVKLTVADVHSLRREPGFEGQDIYFYLNHPIQYVYIVGPIVGIEDLGLRYALITVDDGSGACINVKIIRKDRLKVIAGESNTEVKNLNVESYIGRFDILIDGKDVDVGTVVKAKCTISTFRDSRQLNLKRINIITDTNEEAVAWKETARFKRDILSKPWVLTSAERESVDSRILENEKALRDNERRARAEMRARGERHAKRAQMRREHEERVEQRRKEKEMKYNAGALPGSDRVYQSEQSWTLRE